MQAAPFSPNWIVLLPGALMLLVGVAIVLGLVIHHGKGKALLAIFGALAFSLLALLLMSHRPPQIALAPPVVVAPQSMPQELSPPKIDLDEPEETGLRQKNDESPGELMRLVRTAIGALTNLERRTQELADRAVKLENSPAAAQPAPPAAPKPPLPEWITSPAKPVGNVWRAVVNAGPYSTADEARAELSAVLLAKTQDYLRDELGFTEPADLALSGQDLVERLVTKQHVAEEERSFATMFTAYAQLEIDSSNRVWLEHRVQHQRQQLAVRHVGGLGAVVLGGLASVLGLLKLDESTAGRYRKRLLMGGPAAIIGAVAVLLR